MSHHRIEYRNVSFSYPDETPVLNNINFTITHGESVALIGANGAGKSTFLQLLCGIYFPSAGLIQIGDVTVSHKTIVQIRSHIGFCFQNPDDQLFMPTVYEDIAFGPRNQKIDPREVEKRVTAALTTVGISHLKDRPPYKLSSGEKRAVAIATVLAMEPDILAMDEPTSALDPSARRRFIQLIQKFHHTKIIATHDLDMVMELCERTIVLKNGVVMFDGATSNVMKNRELLQQCHLEQPLTLQGCLACRTSHDDKI